MRYSNCIQGLTGQKTLLVQCMKTAPPLCHSGRSPARAAVRAEGKWTPFWPSRLRTCCKLERRDGGSHRRRAPSHVSDSRRRKAARVNRLHRVLWNQWSMRRDSQAGVNVSAAERINYQLVTLGIFNILLIQTSLICYVSVNGCVSA